METVPAAPSDQALPKVPIAIAILSGSALVATSMVLDHKGYKDYSKAILVTTVLLGGILSAIRFLTDE